LEEFENASFSFSCGKKHFENGALQQLCKNHAISLPELSSNTTPKSAVIVAVFKFFCHSVDRKYYMYLDAVSE